jgi:hypothetical protein
MTVARVVAIRMRCGMYKWLMPRRFALIPAWVERKLKEG